MEVRRFHTNHAATLMEDTVEGRMVLRVDNTAALPAPYGVNGAAYRGMVLQNGVRVPVTAAEAARARFVVAFDMPGYKSPYFVGVPAYSYALRQGFDRAGNLPMTPTVHLVWPGQKENMVIPSGWNVICYEGGTYTVTSGQWVYSPLIVPGVELEVHYRNVAQRGMLQISSVSGVPVAMCREVSEDFKLTFDLYHT
jgi:hypothetical protein